MVRNYKKKGCWKSYTPSTMQAAVDAVLNSIMTYRKASVVYRVPQTTLERHVRKQREDPTQRLTKNTEYLYKRRCVFTKRQEQRLVNYLASMKQNLFGLTSREVRKLAFQLASRNGQDHPFNKDEGIAGADWFVGFHRRHPELSLKKLESTLSSASSTAPPSLSKAAVDKFFDRLEELASDGISADRIYNADEVGITFNKRSRVKKTRRRFTLDNGAIITAEICFSAAGVYMPPTIVFPGDQAVEEFKDGLPAGSRVRVDASGCFTNELYFDWFKEFVVFSKATPQSRVLLLVDGLSPFIKNLDLLDYANEHGVTFLCFPPHSLTRLEPIVVSFVKTLSLYYEDEARLWLHTHPGQVISASQVFPLFGSAYLQTASGPAAIASFAKTGLCPMVRLSVIQEVDFLNESTNDNNVLKDNMLDSNSFTPVIPSRDESPSRSHLQKGLRHAGSKSGLPFRVASGLTPILKSRTFTSGLRAPNKTNDGSTVVKRGCEEKAGGSGTPNSNSRPPSLDSHDHYDPSCLYCNDFYSNAKEGWWLRCEQCLRWAHHTCAGFDDENDQVCFHVCKTCA